MMRRKISKANHSTLTMRESRPVGVDGEKIMEIDKYIDREIDR